MIYIILHVVLIIIKFFPPTHTYMRIDFKQSFP